MKVIEEIIASLPTARVTGVTIGLFLTAVEVERDGLAQCGLAASTIHPDYGYKRVPAIRDAGNLEQYSGLELANLALSESTSEVSVGLAAINALMPRVVNSVDLPAEEYIAHHGKDKQVVVVGHFPFVTRLREQVKKLSVLELNPGEGDLPASAAPDVIPAADILAITAMTLINRTFEGLLQWRKPGARVLVLGPSTPLTPILFRHGVDVLSGAIVEEPSKVLPLVRQGATFRQIRPNGVRLVTIERESHLFN